MLTTPSVARASVIPPCRPEVSMASRSISDCRDRVLAEFQQNAAGSGGMHKDVEMSARAYLDFVRDKAHTFPLQLFEGIGDIVDVDGYMMQPLPTLGDKFGDHGIVRRRLEQFETAFPHGDHGSTHLLMLHDLFTDHMHAELLVKFAAL